MAVLSLPEAEVQTPYSASLEVLGGAPPYSVSVVKGSLPSGLTINDTSLVGTPTTTKRGRFSIEVRDQNNAVVTRELSINIFKALTIATSRLKAGIAGRNYFSALKVKGGKAPYNWSIVSGTLQPGISWNASGGELTGVPTSIGTFGLVFQLNDSLGGIAQKSVALTIK